MNILAYVIGVPLGLWLSDEVHKIDWKRVKRDYEKTIDNRFAADQRTCEEYEQHQSKIADADTQRRAEFRKHNER